MAKFWNFSIFSKDHLILPCEKPSDVKNLKRISITVIALIVGCLTFGGFSQNNLANAATISKVQGAKALIDLDGLEVSEGDDLFAFRNGKKVAILRVTKVGSKKAVAEIRKGKAKPGYEVELRSGGGGSSSSSDGFFKMGLLGAVSMNTQSVALSNTAGTVKETVSMTGMGYGIYGIGDHGFTESLFARALIGIDFFKVSGTSQRRLCGKGTSGDCSTTINFLSMEAFGKYHITGGDMVIWIGPGLGLAIPWGNSTNALDGSSIATNIVYGAGLGVDWKFGSTVIPIQVDYMMFPGSGDVTTNSIRLRLGMFF